MNLKVQYEYEDEKTDNLSTKTGFLQDFVVIKDKTHGVIIDGKVFKVIPLEKILIEKNLV